jgi:hypothetical protein
MTAQRWWVKLFARWQARVDSSLQEINLGLRMISSGGIGSAALTYLGHRWLVIPFLASMLLAIMVYAYLTFEGGVKNQVARDRADMIGNFASPGNMIDDVLIGVAVFSAVHNRQPKDEELEMIIDTVRKQWEEYRDGIDIEQ